VTHVLKTWVTEFEAVLGGQKRHEIRVADRPYCVGDILHLREFIPHALCRASGTTWSSEDGFWWVPKPCECSAPHGIYTGRECFVNVRYISQPSSFGLPGNLVVMSIDNCAEVSGTGERGCHTEAQTLG
jgi:hypothetical protein